MSATRSYRKSDGVVSRKIRGEHLLVPLVQASHQIDSIFTLNPTASLILDHAAAGESSTQIRDALVGAFRVDVAAAEADVERTLRELVEIGALEPTEA